MRVLLRPPAGRLLIAAVMAGYDAALHLVFVFWGVDYWVKIKHLIFWPRLYADPDYNFFWGAWHVVIVALVISAVIHLRFRRGDAP